MSYYLKPGEKEELAQAELQSAAIGAALSGKKKPPDEAIIEEERKKAVSYYQECAFPKPGSAKKKKKTNGYKDKPYRTCYYCGTPNAERHEVYPGTGTRQICIDEGFQVDLCPDCHRAVHANDTPQAQAMNKFWREKYQREYEENLITAGKDPEDARQAWILLIGRSYL